MTTRYGCPYTFLDFWIYFTAFNPSVSEFYQADDFDLFNHFGFEFFLLHSKSVIDFVGACYQSGKIVRLDRCNVTSFGRDLSRHSMANVIVIIVQSNTPLTKTRTM